jgi:hypothetical protein
MLELFMTIKTQSLPLFNYYTSTIETSVGSRELAEAIQPRFDTRQSSLARTFAPDVDLEPIPFEGTISDEAFKLSYNPPSRRRTYRAIYGTIKQSPHNTLIEVRSASLVGSILGTVIMLGITVVMLYFFVQGLNSGGGNTYRPLAFAGIWIVAVAIEVVRQHRMYFESLNAFAGYIQRAEDAVLKPSPSGAVSSH